MTATAAKMAHLAGEAAGAGAEQALVLSTGVIGTFLPMDKIAAGVTAATNTLAGDEDACVRAARGMMTTDTRHKLAGRACTLAGRAIHVCGLAKGAAMIGPNMATMLCVVLTDAALLPDTAQQLLREAVDVSFNCISVEGHTSTSDSVLLLANGAACAEPPRGEDLAELKSAIVEVCTELARAIPEDGEGAQHLVTIDVAGCATAQDARQIAKAVANSALVKTGRRRRRPELGPHCFRRPVTRAWPSTPAAWDCGSTAKPSTSAARRWNSTPRKFRLRFATTATRTSSCRLPRAEPACGFGTNRLDRRIRAAQR